MATNVLALDAASGAPAYSGQNFRDALSALAGPAPAGRPLGAVSGVRSGAPPATAFLSGTNNFTWNVAAHSGVMDVETSTSAGPYLYSTDGTDTGAVTASTTQARIDSLYMQINDNVQDGSALETGGVLYLAGTPGSGSPPTLPNTRTMVLANINVPATGGGNPTISWVAPTAGAQPTCVVYATAAQTVTTSTAAISFGAASINVGGMWTSGTNVVIGIPGTYVISGQYTLAGTTWTALSYAEALVRINGGSVAFDLVYPPGGALGSLPISTGDVVVQCNAGDVITLAGVQNQGGSLSIVTGLLYTSMTVRRLP